MAVLSLRVETPLFVLGGGSAVVGLDAFYKDGYLYLVDLTHPAVLSGVREPVIDAVVRVLAQSPARFAYASYPSPQLPQNAEVKIGRAPPASTIKGLLRTAYLRLVLERDPGLAGKFINAVRSALQEGSSPKFLASRGEDAVFKRFFDRRRFDIFNLVRVKELRLSTIFKVYKVDVAEGGAVKASFYAVGAAPGSAFEYGVEVSPMVNESGGREWIISEGDLKEALDLFAKEVSEFERQKGRHVPCDRGVRLGFGAGRRWKTVLNFLQRRDPQLYQDIERLMSRRLGRVWDDLTVKTAEGRPVGWVCYEWK
ncbi:CRISPR-associated protein [Pyrobaculum aerophilum]|uniref:CRISPR-associated protein n=1 Tax=Pyrobaculum aerophilum TaxID=13773 RepID=UPI00257BF1F1|nr:CRISPR-associated protein [Pyrobaculum sp.]